MLVEHTLATIIHARLEHLIPHFVDVSAVLANKETFEVLLYEKTRRMPSKPCGIADRPVLRRNLNKTAAKYINAKACASFAIF